MRKKILVLVFSDLKHDARVKRQIAAFYDKYDVTVACFDSAPAKHFNLITFVPKRLSFFRKATTSVFLMLKIYPVAYHLLYGYRSLVKKLSLEKFDLVIANDVETLPLAFSIPHRPKILFDAHEYAPRHFEDKKMWRFFFQGFNLWICNQYLPRVNAMTTVGKGLALEYEKHFGVKPTVITNANNFFDIKPTSVSGTVIRLVHHGIATRSRQLELMIELMDLLDDRFRLDLILLIPGSASAGTIQYLADLKSQAAKNPKINFPAPVESADVVTTINQYDIGVFLLPPVNFNYQNTLPNKLFDFIQARLGIAIGPTPEMAEIVNHYSNGVVSEDFTPKNLAEKLNHLSKQDIERFKHNSANAAAEINAEKNKVILNSIVDQLINS